MTLAVCPNLAVDRVVRVDRLEPGTTMRAHMLQHQAGGKGANVVRAVKALGGRAELVGFAAGDTGRLIGELATAEGLDVLLVVCGGEARVSTVVLELGGGHTELYEYGPRITADDEKSFVAAVRHQRAGRGEWAVVDGSPPPGASAHFFGSLVDVLHANGYSVLLDATGVQLVNALPARPELAKVNLAEAHTAVGTAGDDLAGAYAACQGLVAAGAGGAIVTLAADGAVGLIEGRRLRATTEPVEAVNPCGSGDCFAAALLRGLERKDKIEAALAAATGVAAANAASPLTAHFDAKLAAHLTAAATVESAPSD